MLIWSVNSGAVLNTAIMVVVEYKLQVSIRTFLTTGILSLN